VSFVQAAAAYHNMEAGADLFSAINVPFWEYVLPAFDASGSIVPSTCSYAVRASALQAVGLYRTRTVAEDIALGPDLKAANKHGVYLQQYLMYGEAAKDTKQVSRQGCWQS
jgi:cellulose synthase/poly-beta-1,6-N-acetylglucosamine synthase-like glycosyltransferase